MKKIILPLTILLGIMLIGGGLVFFNLNKMHYTKIDKNDEALGITPVFENTSKAAVQIHNTTGAGAAIKPKVQSISNQNNIINIALFGIDRRSKKESGRSDCTMILTIDYKRRLIKLTSFMRDLYVNVDGHGKTKLTHAYAYGGPQLAIKTLNENFGLDIRDYLTVDFSGMQKIIDALGGVRINLKSYEVQYINNEIISTSESNTSKVGSIKNSGIQLLNGSQALIYARIRYVGNGDFERTERQRTMLETIIKEITSRGKASMLGIAMKILPYVETSMNKVQILSLGTDYFKLNATEFEEERFPIDGYWKSDMSTGIYYIKSDLNVCRSQVMNYIYRNQKPAKQKG